MQRVYQIIEGRSESYAMVQSESDFQAFIKDLSDHIISLYENQYIDKTWKTIADLFSETETIYIRKEISKYILAKDQELRETLRGELSDYCRNACQINLEGFFQFRAKKYRLQLLNFIDEAIENILYEIEYRQFVENVSCYLSMQPSMVQAIYLMQNGAEYRITDENQQTILTLSKFEEPLLDMIITLAPKEIYIQNPDSFCNQALLQTIQEVFREHIHILGREE